MAANPPILHYAVGCSPLLASVAEVTRPGAYCSVGTTPMPMPRLEVAGFGTLAFPVSPEQARGLIAAAASRAPFGRGAETVLDESVRKVWQVPAAAVSLGGTGWSKGFADLLGRVAHDLALPAAKVEASLYKLLIYDAGGHFAAHRDTEKELGMFGTLVVSLPSGHSGGALTIRHAGQTTVTDLACADPGEVRHAAFYADCEHAVAPVASGYRVCLVFNLLHRGSTKSLPKPADYTVQVAETAKALRAWTLLPMSPTKLVWLLDHHYTPASLSWAELKGCDAGLASVLTRAAAQASFSLHLALVHLEESGVAEYTGYDGYGHHRDWDDEDDDEESESSSEFKVGEVYGSEVWLDGWRTPEDIPVQLGRIPVGPGETLPPGSLDNQKPDKLSYHEATGNEGVSFERTYLRAALVLWPSEHTEDVLLKAGAAGAIQLLRQRLGPIKGGTTSSALGMDTLFAKVDSILECDRETTTDLIAAYLTCLRLHGDSSLWCTHAPSLAARHFSGVLLDELARLPEWMPQHIACASLKEALTTGAAVDTGAVLELWNRLADSKPHGLEQARVLFPALEQTLRTLGEIPSPTEPPRGMVWHRPTEVSPVSPERCSRHLNCVESLLGRDAVLRTLDTWSQLERRFDLHESLVAALLAKSTDTSIGRQSGSELWEHCVRHLLERSEQPTREPEDWALAYTAPPGHTLFAELQDFARDPKLQGYRFRVRQELRQKIENEIRRAGLDMDCVTDRRGSPQSLICTKNRATYKRARLRRNIDLKALAALAQLPEANAGLVARIRNLFE